MVGSLDTNKNDFDLNPLLSRHNFLIYSPLDCFITHPGENEVKTCVTIELKTHISHSFKEGLCANKWQGKQIIVDWDVCPWQRYRWKQVPQLSPYHSTHTKIHEDWNNFVGQTKTSAVYYFLSLMFIDDFHKIIYIQRTVKLTHTTAFKWKWMRITNALNTCRADPGV